MRAPLSSSTLRFSCPQKGAKHDFSTSMHMAGGGRLSRNADDTTQTSVVKMGRLPRGFVHFPQGLPEVQLGGCLGNFGMRGYRSSLLLGRTQFWKEFGERLSQGRPCEVAVLLNKASGLAVADGSTQIVSRPQSISRLVAQLVLLFEQRYEIRQKVLLLRIGFLFGADVYACSLKRKDRGRFHCCVEGG